MKCIQKPIYTNKSGEYEIFSPGQLLFFAKKIGKLIPRNAVVRLMCDLDMAGIENFKPIGWKRENCFLGHFYGGGHIVRNLVMSFPGKKDVSLFGTVGDGFEQGHIYDLGVVDFEFLGSKNVGGIIGTQYGTAERCFCIGKIHSYLDTNAMCAGGLAGKSCCLEDGTPAVFRDCYAHVEIDGAFAVGGLIGKDDGGILENCYCSGSILAQNHNGQAGGICGSFNAGQGAKNCVTMLRSIAGPKDIDKTVGQLEDEDGHQMENVLAWDGIRLHGQPPKEQNFHWSEVSREQLQEQRTWKALGWDFKKVWEWGDGYPVLRAFSREVQKKTLDWHVDAAVSFSAPHKYPKGKPMDLHAHVITDGKVNAVRLHWQDKLGEGTELMQAVGKGVYAYTLPPKKHKVLLTVEAETTLGTIGGDRTYAVRLDSGKVKPAPRQICLTMGENELGRRVNWVTDPRVLDSVLEYRLAGQAEWVRVRGTAYVFSVTPGFRELASHKAEFGVLETGAHYEYRVGDGVNMSDIFSFHVTDPKNGFRFLFGSDSQSVTVEDYSTYVKCMNWYAEQGKEFAFSAMGGDISQDGYKGSQWAAFFKASGAMFAQTPFVPVLGNHDVKGDPTGRQFKGHFNMPKNGACQDLEETNYSFTYGNAAFYIINSECARVSDLKEQIRVQMEWLTHEVAEKKKRWNIVLLHSGPYTANHDATKIRDTEMMAVCERIGIDLLLNGHDHLYVRTTMKQGTRVPLGDGVTYVTCGTVGNKFYEFLPDKAADFTEVFFDAFDRQILCEVLVSDEELQFMAWQKIDSKDKECRAFAVCDQFVLH